MGDPSTVPEGQYATVAMYTAYPQSRGSIHVTGTTLSDVPDFDTGFLSDAHDIDLRTQLWAYKKQREIMRRTIACQGELPQRHPKFPEGSKAALLSLDQSQPKQSGPRFSPSTLAYNQEDDEAIIQYIRENVNTTWHSMGTAKMAPRENGGVVDKSLNVYGVIGLKCADMSIAPENVGANTCNTAMAIAEKAASIIAVELGLVL
jgi:alcohol oxidase